MTGTPHPVFRDNIDVEKSEARAFLALRMGTIDNLRDADGSTFWLVFIDELNSFFERDSSDTTSADDGTTVIVDATGGRWLRIGGGDVVGPDAGVADGDIVLFGDGTGKVVRKGTVSEVRALLSISNVDNTSDASKPISTLQQAALDLKINLSAIDTDVLLAANSDTKVSSQKAIKAYVDALALVVSGALIFKGAFDASAGTFPGTAGRKTGWFYRTSVAGTVDGISFGVGDHLYAIVDTASTTTYAANWLKVEGALSSAEIIAALASNSIALAKIAQGTALSVVGVTGNATANYADIVAGTNGYVLIRSGTSLVFGQIVTASITDGNVTLAKIANISAARLLGSVAGGVPSELTITQVLDLVTGTAAQGDILFRGATTMERLAASTANRVLKTKGAGQNPVFEGPDECIIVACSDESTALTAGTNKIKFRMPYGMTLTAVRASLSTAQAGNGAGGIFTVDINEGGTTILSTKLTIDNTETTSTTAATAAVISDASLADDAEMSVDIDQIGDGSAKGLKIMLIGRRT